MTQPRVSGSRSELALTSDGSKYVRQKLASREVVVSLAKAMSEREGGDQMEQACPKTAADDTRFYERLKDRHPRVSDTDVHRRKEDIFEDLNAKSVVHTVHSRVRGAPVAIDNMLKDPEGHMYCRQNVCTPGRIRDSLMGVSRSMKNFLQTQPLQRSKQRAERAMGVVGGTSLSLRSRSPVDPDMGAAEGTDSMVEERMGSGSAFPIPADVNQLTGRKHSVKVLRLINGHENSIRSNDSGNPLWRSSSAPSLNGFPTELSAAPGQVSRVNMKQRENRFSESWRRSASAVQKIHKNQQRQRSEQMATREQHDQWRRNKHVNELHQMRTAFLNQEMVRYAQVTAEQIRKERLVNESTSRAQQMVRLREIQIKKETAKLGHKATMGCVQSQRQLKFNSESYRLLDWDHALGTNQKSTSHRKSMGLSSRGLVAEPSSESPPEEELVYFFKIARIDPDQVVTDNMVHYNPVRHQQVRKSLDVYARTLA